MWLYFSKKDEEVIPEMKENTPEGLSEQHLMLFGAIIQWFARHELLMQDIMAAVAGSDTAAIMLLTHSLDFREKREALLNLLRHRAVPQDQFDRVSEYLMPLYTLTPLRNDIAHAAWVMSPSRNSIQPDWILHPLPGIEPLRNEPSAPEKNFVERDCDGASYTLDDLCDIVETLASNHDSFSGYLRKSGLIDPDPEANTTRPKPP